MNNIYFFQIEFKKFNIYKEYGTISFEIMNSRTKLFEIRYINIFLSKELNTILIECRYYHFLNFMKLENEI